MFNGMEDRRADNASYSMSDAPKSGFAIYPLKCASLFSFSKRSQAEESNLATVYGIDRILFTTDTLHTVQGTSVILFNY